MPSDARRSQPTFDALGELLRRRWIRYLLIAAGVAGVATVGIVVNRQLSGDAPVYVPADPSLRDDNLFFYPAQNVVAPRAFLFFFGNDIGFWQPHRQLAVRLAREGYSIVGFNMKHMLSGLEHAGDKRDSLFQLAITSLVARTRHELLPRPDDDTIPLILVGHSLGAEIALWTAAHVDLPHLVGVVAISPGNRSHLEISASDVLNGPEPTGPESFAVPDVVRQAVNKGNMRMAFVRGQRDKLRNADPALLAAAGVHGQLWRVFFAGHSMKDIVLARIVVSRALDWVLEGIPAASLRAASSP